MCDLKDGLVFYEWGEPCGDPQYRQNRREENCKVGKCNLNGEKVQNRLMTAGRPIEMPWTAYLEQLKEQCDGCAIVSLSGAVCGTQGEFSNPNAEIQFWPTLFQRPEETKINGVKFNGQKMFVIRAEEDYIVAHRDNRVVIMQKANTVLVVAHANTEKFRPRDINTEVGRVVSTFLSLNV